MKKIKFLKLSTEARRHFWSMTLKAQFEVPLAVSNNDIPSLEQQTKFLLGIEGVDEIYNIQDNEIYKELK